MSGGISLNENVYVLFACHPSPPERTRVRTRVSCTQVGSIPKEERTRIKDTIDGAGIDKAGSIPTDMFDVIQQTVFKDMFYNTFQRFVASPEYTKMRDDIKNAYNKVSLGGGGTEQGEALWV